MAPTVTTTTVTTVLQTTDFGDGKYEVKELKADEIAIPELHSGNRKQIDFPLPVPGLAVVGYYDVDDKELGLYLTLGGSQIGTKYSAGIDSGINIGIDLWLASGSVGVFKSGNDIKLRYGVSVGAAFFKKEYNDEVKLFEV